MISVSAPSSREVLAELVAEELLGDGTQREEGMFRRLRGRTAREGRRAAAP